MGSAPRTTVELEPRLYRALKRRARGSKRSLTRLVNKAVREALEDAHDLAVARRRLRQPSRPYKEVLANLKRKGLL
ncbi:MAG: CopG family transcriptional regulator [Acidobacteria bacterium]|nr:CopG family transcriptional regulator [Acidobacteriota bacterium]